MEEKTNKLQVHPYKPVSWSPTSSGDLMRINFTIAYIQYSLSNLCSAKLSLVIAQEGFVSVAARRHEFITFV